MSATTVVAVEEAPLAPLVDCSACELVVAVELSLAAK